MARRINSMTTLTPTAFADTTSLTDATYPNLIRGASATQVNNIWEISISGQAAASSSPTFMVLAYSSKVGTGTNTLGAGQMDSPLNAATAAIAAPTTVGNSNGTLKPERSSTLHLANCSLNAFGGVYFWRANRAEECFTAIGASANLGEITLSAFTGGTPGAVGSHLIYETV